MHIVDPLDTFRGRRGCCCCCCYCYVQVHPRTQTSACTVENATHAQARHWETGRPALVLFVFQPAQCDETVGYSCVRNSVMLCRMAEGQHCSRRMFYYDYFLLVDVDVCVFCVALNNCTGSALQRAVCWIYVVFGRSCVLVAQQQQQQQVGLKFFV